MKYGRSLQELAIELDRQAKVKKDYVATAGAMQMTAVNENFDLVIGNTPFQLNENAHRQLGLQLKIPAPYYERMRAENPGLLMANVNGWFQQSPDTRRMVRTLDGTARAILSDRYRRIDNYEVAQTVLPIISEMQGARIESCELTDAAKFQKKFFYNDATPTTLISMPGSSKDQRDRFRSEWNERFRGPFNSHGIATVDGNVTVTKLAENMRDMDMTEGRRFLRDAVLEHFGVPREIMGITESSNRATSEAAQYIYAQNVIMPRLNRREEAINTQILPFYGNDLVWHFDDVVPRSQEFDKAKGIDGWNAGLLTKDEARELLGMEPCKTGGDCFKITISDMFIGSNDDPAEVTTDLMQESTDEVEVTDDEDTGGMLFMSDRREHEEKSRVQNIGNLLAAAQKAQRAKFEVATMKFFRQQQKRLSGSLSGTEKADWSVWDVLMPYITENHVEDSAAWSALGEQEQKNLVEQFIGGLVNWPSEETAMEEIFKPLWKQTYDEGTRIAKQAYNIRGVDRPELLSQAKLHGGKRVRRVTQTTKENISRIVANGIEAGIGREKMADEILQEYEIQTRSRARLIADQETVMTLETGHYDMMQKSGATTKTWHHRPQKNPRDGSNGGPNHVKMDGETVPIDARFSNGLRYPCDPEGPARETIKCRCYVTYNR